MVAIHAKLQRILEMAIGCVIFVLVIFVLGRELKFLMQDLANNGDCCNFAVKFRWVSVGIARMSSGDNEFRNDINDV